ncbi:conserved protein of unknown function [Methanocaldococcus lauensis]|nr:conserved protein of unknown function [Methanocaldococcus lauensis]
MIRGHVFVVNENTLPIHLKYQFVGTGAGDRDSNISLLADMLRVKEGDYIFFYIEGSENKKGRFFGIFKSKDNKVYHLKGEDAKKPNLPKKLIYRKDIEPYKIYSEGVLEFIALDKLPIYSRELLWMLIYRKMKGKRGNTMLFPWEVERLLNMIKDENNGNIITCKDGYDFDNQNFRIICGDKKYYNHGESFRLNFNKRDINSETAFQAYIMQELKIENNKYYPEIFGKNIAWIGNEVFAGAGMQKIDILTIEKADCDDILYRIIELKYVKNNNLDDIKRAPKQLEYYIKWARDDIGGHLRNAKSYNTKPILLILDKTNNILSNPENFPKDVLSEIKDLNKISYEPEIWVMDFNNNIEKIL